MICARGGGDEKGGGGRKTPLVPEHYAHDSRGKIFRVFRLPTKPLGAIDGTFVASRKALPIMGPPEELDIPQMFILHISLVTSAPKAYTAPH